MNQAKAQYWGAVAKAARLEAETKDRLELAMPADLLSAAEDPAIASLVQAERNLFESRWETFDGNARISARKIDQLQVQAAAVQTQIYSLEQSFR